ncbi:MAG: GAF domain-containing protein [Xenococcaceae cyanobacterium]
MSTQFDPNTHSKRPETEVAGLNIILQRLNQKIERDRLVQSTTNELRRFLQVDRVVLYHFYIQWEGQVTFESLSDKKFSILGSTGPDLCFNDEYAELYLGGRVRAIADIETEPIQPCHRDFLRYLDVRANLVVPILTKQKQTQPFQDGISSTSHDLWGLLVAHHCQSPRSWSEGEIKRMKAGALAIAEAPSIKDN